MDYFYLQGLEAQCQKSSNESCYSQLPSLIISAYKIRPQEFCVLMWTLLLTHQMVMESSPCCRVCQLAMVRTEAGSVGETCLFLYSGETGNN